MYDAVMHETIWDFSTIGLAAAPEGELIGWGKKGAYIVKMRIPHEAKRSWATTRKLRAEYVVVLEIVNKYTDEKVPSTQHKAWGIHPFTDYTVGKETYPDSWDDNRWNECSHGIHFFLTEHEARMWG